MSTIVPAADGFVQYYTERLWEMIPETYRHEDGLVEGQSRGVLRALIELMGQQAAIVRRSHDRLWDDQFAELSDDWVLPYLADLVGTRLVAALDERARRVSVAKTIHYRRRAGTMGLLEQLVVDVTGWDAAIVEQFRRLARARHLLDPRPAPLVGPLTATPPGGWANLRSRLGPTLAGGPADEYHYTADVRRHRGTSGRFSIPKLAVHLYRLGYFEVVGVTPVDRGGGRFTFDPSGRDIPLFAPRGRADDLDQWHAAREWDLAGPIACRVLGHAEFEITEAIVLSLLQGATAAEAAAIPDLRRLIGRRIPNEAALVRLINLLAQPANLVVLLAMLGRIRTAAIIPDCGSAALLAPASPAGEPAALRVISSSSGAVPREEIVSANLGAWPIAATAGRTLAVDPERGRFQFFGGAPAGRVTVDYHYGFSGPIGAGPYDRRDADEAAALASPTGGGAITAAQLPAAGVSRIADSLTYTSVADATNFSDLSLVAADGQRPYLRLNGDWQLDSGTQPDAILLLDGLWIGGLAQREIILLGDYETVTIQRCTLDPGSLTAAGLVEKPAVHLIVEGHVERMVISRSITGPILTRNAGVVEMLEVSDSIVQSITAGTPALSVGATAAAVEAGDTTLSNVTIFGDVAVHRLSATGSIITGVATVVDRQRGCFRFSAGRTGSLLPRRYQSDLFATDPLQAFTTRRFGQPGYAQLTVGAPEALRSGGEDGAELGAFASFRAQLKLEGLTAKLDEYAPFGRIPIFLNQT